LSEELEQLIMRLMKIHQLTYLINDVDLFMELSILFKRGMGDLLASLQKDTKGPPEENVSTNHYSPPPTSVFKPK
jgi:hypothetical protein